MQLLKTRFIRFVLVGAINTIFGTGIYCVLIYIGIHYKLAVLLSTILGVLFNFKTTGSLVFNNKENGLLFKFILSYTVVYFLNISLIRLLLKFIYMDEYIAGIAASLISAVISFALQNEFVFQKNNK